MIAFRSSPFSFPATNCILIVLIAPCRRCDDINYSTTWKLFSFLFSPSFPLFSQPLAKDTLPRQCFHACAQDAGDARLKLAARVGKPFRIAHPFLSQQVLSIGPTHHVNPYLE